jgi:hypothetical protein
MFNIAVDIRCRHSLSTGWAVSLLGAQAPVGSHLSRFSLRSLAPSATINEDENHTFSLKKVIKNSNKNSVKHAVSKLV